MLEYTTERCRPNEVDEVCQIAQAFGWKIEQTQEVYSENTQMIGQNTHLVGQEDIFGNYKNVHLESTPITRTNVTHYVSLRFSRDTSMPNYQRIKELENMCLNPDLGPLPKNTIPKPKRSSVRIKVLAYGGFFGIGPIIGSYLSGNTGIFIAVLLAYIAFVAVSIFLIVNHRKKYRIAMDAYEKAEKDYTEKITAYHNLRKKKRNEAITEALSLQNL